MSKLNKTTGHKAVETYWMVAILFVFLLITVLHKIVEFFCS